MPATETLLQGATQVTGSLSANYTAGGGTIQVGTQLLDHGGTPVAVPFEILVGRNRGATERRYFVVSAMTAGGALTLVASPGYTDNQNFLAGDLVDLISAWETQRRLRAFATLHTHTGGVDGPTLAAPVVAHSALTGVTADQHHAQSHAIGGADHSGTLAHTALSAIGTNTHAQIDTALATGVTNDATAASHIAATAAHGATGAVVGTTNSQTLTAKTLTTPTIGDFTNAQHLHTSGATGGVIAGAPAFATPAIVLGSAAAAGSAGTIIRSDGTIVAFDATAPTTQAFADAAVVGTAAFAAHRDHKHGMPSIAVANLPTVPRCHAYNTTVQSINDSTVTAITLNSERYDTDTIHDTSTNTERLTCKTAGEYIITGSVAYLASAGGTFRQLRLNHNVSGIIAAQIMPTVGTGSETVIIVVTQWVLAVNEYVWISVYHNNGGPLNTNADASYAPFLAMTWVSP